MTNGTPTTRLAKPVLAYDFFRFLRRPLATLAIFEEDNILQRNFTLAEQINVALQPLAQHPGFRHFRQQGMIWACDAVIHDAEAARTFSRRFFTEAARQELLIRPIHQTVYLMPPYILDDEEVDILASRLKQVADRVMYGA